MATMSTNVAATRVSFEAFLARPDSDRRAEWIEGWVEYQMPVSLAHQLLCKFLLLVLELFVHDRNLGTVLCAPFLMKIPSRPSGREPDLLFISNSSQMQLRPTYLDGPADLVVEIISPEIRERDRTEKFEEYESAGIPEYWLIDPELKIADFYVLRGGVYRPARIDAEGRFWSAVLPGFWIDVNWLWDQPGLREVLQRWQVPPDMSRQ
jgi:Uma2 family endonuclease